MRAHYSYKIGLFLHDKPAIEIDENDHSNINIDYERKRNKRKWKKLCCKFVAISSEKENVYIFEDINEIFRQIKQKHIS